MTWLDAKRIIFKHKQTIITKQKINTMGQKVNITSWKKINTTTIAKYLGLDI